MASYIKERTKNAQFIVISLRNNMFELASRLVGVYKVNHMVSGKTWSKKLSALTLLVADEECDGGEQGLYQATLRKCDCFSYGQKRVQSSVVYCSVL